MAHQGIGIIFISTTEILGIAGPHSGHEGGAASTAELPRAGASRELLVAAAAGGESGEEAA
ncbi:MAG: hypothetical protein U0075_07785 [Thermomicrobiales bacterium]